MEQKQILFEISEIEESFQKHLDIKNNHRIIFSGAFGIGKTYFLNHFFDNRREHYNAFFLRPVNYSVASNEDVFSLIKYDIFYELLNYNIDLKENISSDIKLAYFISENWEKVISLFLSAIPKVGKQSSSVWEKLFALKKDYQTLSKETDKTELDHAKSFAEGLENKEGSIYEMDFYTNLIYYWLAQIRNEDQQNVLIIDDLDRIDPEHIFRLFNVFSSHLDDQDEKKNKFDFDQVIFVCDIENIHKIFKNRYGQDVDFSGYIDKFYSYRVYTFLNKENIKSKIKVLLRSINVENSFINTLNFKDENQNTTAEIIFILNALVDAGCINLRNLLKLNGWDFSIELYSFSIQQKQIYNSQLTIILVFDILKFIYGTQEGLTVALERLMNNHKYVDLKDSDDPDNFFKTSSLLPILDNDQINFKANGFIEYDYNFKDYKLHYSINCYKEYSCKLTKVLKDGDQDIGEISNAIYLELLHKTFIELEKMGFM